MVVGFVGVERIVGFVGVKFVVVHVVGANVLTKVAYSSNIESLQLCLLWSDSSRLARGVACSR